MNNKYFLILSISIITLFAFFLRTYQINKTPTLLWDEAALGYNAYSILQTGKDEYGTTLPLIFKSFGDYKPGVYVYLATPFIALFGLNSISVRLPSIILGSFIPLILFLLIKTISPKSQKLALLSAFFISFNPFNIHFSRGSWETNVLTFQLLLGSYLLIKYLKGDKVKNLFLSALTFGISLYTYQAAKMIAPLIILVTLIVFNKLLSLKNVKAYLLGFILPLFLFSLPILQGVLFSSDSNRLKVVSLFSYPRSEQETTQILSESNPTNYQIFHSHPIFFSRNFLSRYFNHFTPEFLAFKGDWQNLRHSAPYIGVLLYPSLIFFFIGLFSNTLHKKQKLFFALWLLAAPIPAALTRDSVTAVRAMSLSIPLIYFTALGIQKSYQLIKTKLAKIFFISFISLVYFFTFIYYSDLYLNHLLKKDPGQYLYGYQQVMEHVIKYQDNYQTINITNFYGQPYIYYLFYSKYPPKDYQPQSTLVGNSLDTGTIEKIDNITFYGSDYVKAQNTPNSLTIFSHDEILRQGIDKLPEFKDKFIPLSPINNLSTFYAYHN
jgi:4-amino-4-deoxy-L-arabinose transferase-like glycosyltransferase